MVSTLTILARYYQYRPAWYHQLLTYSKPKLKLKDKNRSCLLYKKWKMIKVKVNQLSLDGKQSASASASEQLKLTRPLDSYEEKQFWNAIYLLRSKVRKIIRKAALAGNEAQRTMGEPWNCKPPPSPSEFKFKYLIRESDFFNFQCSPNFLDNTT